MNYVSLTAEVHFITFKHEKYENKLIFVLIFKAHTILIKGLLATNIAQCTDFCRC